jgi:hypothetical protein
MLRRDMFDVMLSSIPVIAQVYNLGVKPDSLKPDSLKPDSLKPDSLKPDSLELDDQYLVLLGFSAAEYLDKYTEAGFIASTAISTKDILHTSFRIDEDNHIGTSFMDVVAEYIMPAMSAQAMYLNDTYPGRKISTNPLPTLLDYPCKSINYKGINVRSAAQKVAHGVRYTFETPFTVH